MLRTILTSSSHLASTSQMKNLEASLLNSYPMQRRYCIVWTTAVSSRTILSASPGWRDPQSRDCMSRGPLCTPTLSEALADTPDERKVYVCTFQGGGGYQAMEDDEVCRQGSTICSISDNQQLVRDVVKNWLVHEAWTWPWVTTCRYRDWWHCNK